MELKITQDILRKVSKHRYYNKVDVLHSTSSEAKYDSGKKEIEVLHLADI